LRQVLAGHGPYPAIVVNRWRELLDSNAAIATLVGGCAPRLLEPPVNVLRLSLHPDGMAPRIVNLAEWRAPLLTQLRHRAAAMSAQRLSELHDELLDTRAVLPGPAPRPASCSRCATGTAIRSCRSSASARRSAQRRT
jgi:MmyB-like transcription regulator ligand binding domain